MRIKVFVAVVVATMLAAPAFADWVPEDGHKMHWPQLPDLDNGMNILASEATSVTTGKLLADDWQCSGTGPVLDIHIWGSWLHDENPGGLDVDLYIFSDIPGTGTEYSRPGDLMWARHFTPDEVQIGEILTSQEPFFDPNRNEVIGFDTQVVQYNFDIPRDEAFNQQKGTIYWLGVQKRHDFDNHIFGWKTSADHWNDDAVYIDFDPLTKPGMQPGEVLQGWEELRAPWTDASGQEHPSLDLSFVITPEPATVTLALLGAGALSLLRRRRMR